MCFQSWMSWEGGVDLVAKTDPNSPHPNIIIHVARMVNTPVGSSPSGMILFRPDPNAEPTIMGFLTGDRKVGGYFGPHLFAETPYENAPVHCAKIKVKDCFPEYVESVVEVQGMRFETRLSRFSPLKPFQRDAGKMPPFHQQGLEAAAGFASLKVNGADVRLVIPTVGITGGPGAVWAPAGFFAR